MVAHFAHHLLTALPVPLLPLIRDDFSLGYTQAGLVVAAFSLSYGIGQLPAGWLADRIGPRVLLTIGILGVAIAGMLVGLSRTFVLMIVFLALMGIAGGGYHPSAAPLISASVEPQNQGRALGLHLIGGSGSFFLAPLAATAIAAAWGWRSAFLVMAVPAAALGITLYLILGKHLKAKANTETDAGQPDTAPVLTVRWRPLVAFMVMAVFAQAVTFSTISFIPIYMVDNLFVTERTAGAFLSFLYSAGLWASPLGGWLSDKLGRVKVVVATGLITGPLIFLLNIVPYGIIPFGALLLALGMMIYTRMPSAESYILKETPLHRRSTIMGAYYFASMEAGGVLTPVMGSLIDRLGFFSSFTIAGIAVVAVTLVCLAFLRGSRD